MRFRVLGTEVYVSFLFAATVALMICMDRTGLVIPTLLAVLIHETGHLFAMWMTECNPKSIRLVPASVQVVRGFVKSEGNEWLITLMGPAANLVSTLVCGINWKLFGNETVLHFAVLNLIIGLFNLLPVRGLDGGTVIRLLVVGHGNPDKAERTVWIVSLVTTAAVFFFAIYLALHRIFNPSVFIIALYFLAATLMKR